MWWRSSARASLVGIVVGLLVWGGGSAAQATMENGKALKEAYPGKDPKSYGCKACHQNAVGKKGDLNAYGQALQASKGEGNAKKLTVEDLRAVEAQDSDKDGASNGQEWQAGTNPSDPASKP